MLEWFMVKKRKKKPFSKIRIPLAPSTKKFKKRKRALQEKADYLDYKTDPDS